MGVCASKPQVDRADTEVQVASIANSDIGSKAINEEVQNTNSSQLSAASTPILGQCRPENASASAADSASILPVDSINVPTSTVEASAAAHQSNGNLSAIHSAVVAPQSLSAAGPVLALRHEAEPAASTPSAVPTSGSALAVETAALAQPEQVEAAVTEAAQAHTARDEQSATGAVPCSVAAHSCTNDNSPTHSARLSGNHKATGQPPRSVKFVDRPSVSDGGASTASSDRAGKPPRVSWGSGVAPDSTTRPVKRVPGRSQSGLIQGTQGHVQDPAVLAKQVEILRSNKMGKLRQRRGGLDSSFAAMQEALEQNEAPISHVNTRAAGLKHIGFGPFKRENQDEFFIQVGEFGGLHSSNLFCVFDGHGTHGKDAALYSRQLLPRLLDMELTKYFQRVNVDSDEGLKGAVEVLITEAFGETERSVSKLGVNLASSGTTATVAFQKGNRLWVASAGDSRAILCCRVRDQWRALPLTIDHRPRRESERERIEAAGARVAPKRLPSGRTVGEPRLWLQNASGPGLLLSRSLGDLTAATVGCTSDPEVSFTTLRPGTDHVLVMASDGVWDVLTNEQVCDIVVESPDPHIACRRVLDAALYEWEERMSADNITVLVVEFDWGEEGSLSLNSLEQAALAGGSGSNERAVEAGSADIPTGAAAVATGPF